MADNTRGIGGLYSSGYGPYQTPTNARFIRRPATNFMTGQTVQNPAIDIFDVTMNPDQFFGGSGTNTFNQTFQGSVSRPGLGSGNPNLGDPTFGDGSGNDGGAGGPIVGGGNNSGGNNGGGNNGGGNNNGGVIKGGGVIGGGGDVDLSLPKGPGSSDQLKTIILSAGATALATKLFDGGLADAATGIKNLLTDDRGYDKEAFEEELTNQVINANQIGLQDNFTNKLTGVIDSSAKGSVAGGLIEEKFQEEDLYDNLDPDSNTNEVIGRYGPSRTIDSIFDARTASMLDLAEGGLGPNKIEKVTVEEVDNYNQTGDDLLQDTAAEEREAIADDMKTKGFTDQEISDFLAKGIIDGTLGNYFTNLNQNMQIPKVTVEEVITDPDGSVVSETDTNTNANTDNESIRISNEEDIFSPDRFDLSGSLTDKFIQTALPTTSQTLGGFAGNADKIGNVIVSDVIDGSLASSGADVGTNLSQFYDDPGMTSAETLVSSLGDSSTYALNEAGNYISSTGNVISPAQYNDLVGAEDVIDTFDEGGGIFNKFGTFMNTPIESIGNVAPAQILGGISGALSLADFIDDPSFSSGLGTLAGAGAAFFPGAAANPYLAGAAVVAGLLEAQQEPSNETGIANLDLGSGEVISYGMGGDKQNDQNVETADTIATAMTPIANDIAETYGVTFEGDIEVGLGNRDDMYVSIGNQEEDSTYMDRLTYNPDEGDLNLMSGVEGQVLTYRYEPQSGEKIVEDLTKNLTLAAQKAVANGETVVNLNNAVGAAPSGEALEQRYADLGLEDYAIDALTRSARGMGGSNGILPQLAVSYDDRQYLTADEEMALIEMGLLNPEDAAFVQENTQYVDSSDPDFVGPLPV